MLPVVRYSRCPNVLTIRLCLNLYNYLYGENLIPQEVPHVANQFPITKCKKIII